MFYFTDSVRSLYASLRNVFRRPTTVEFPAVRRPRPERYRASFALLHDEQGDELCVGCKACERICPSQIITVELLKRESAVSGKKRAYASEFVLDANACIYCELCVQVCPTDAIVMVALPEQPAFFRQDLVLTMERLYENESHKPLSWANATKLAEMQSGETKGGAGTAEGG
jgi:NADH-quinone oxidoreductase subunit I